MKICTKTVPFFFKFENKICLEVFAEIGIVLEIFILFYSRNVTNLPDQGLSGKTFRQEKNCTRPDPGWMWLLIPPAKSPTE